MFLANISSFSCFCVFTCDVTVVGRMRGLETPATGGVPAAEAAHAVEGLRGRAAGYEGEGDK